jgi:hypothetical protein
MPPRGRRAVSRALVVLEQERPLLAFWTITVPPEAMDELAELGTWPRFQSRIRRELIRRLEEAGLVPEVVGVAELQPGRSAREGRPCPHLHLVFKGRNRRGEPWRLTKEALDLVIEAALRSAGARSFQAGNCGNVQPVKKSVRAYLSKYMTKGSGEVSRWKGNRAESLIPRQWWLMSAVLRLRVLQYVTPILAGFVIWAHQNRADLEGLGLASFRVLPLQNPRAPATWEINWLTLGKLAEVIYLWQTDQWEHEWQGNHRHLMHSSRAYGRVKILGPAAELSAGASGPWNRR